MMRADKVHCSSDRYQYHSPRKDMLNGEIKKLRNDVFNLPESNLNSSASMKCKLLTFAFLHIILGVEARDRDSAVGCNSIDRQALMKFKGGLSDPSNLLSTWDTSENCCTWKGIGCSNFTGHVISINLRNADCFYNKHIGNQNPPCLGGEINPSLLNLKYLTYLDLSMNVFLTPIPSYIGSLDKLSYLNLSYAEFTGMIPPHIGNLSNLQYLDICSSYGSKYDPRYLWVSDLFWLTSLTSLKYIKMENVNISLARTHWLQALNCLPSLLEIHFHLCHLHEIPESLPYANFTSLSIIELNDNNIVSSVPRWFANLSALVTLDLSKNQITGDISDLVGDLSDCCSNSLEHLILFENQISGELTDALAQLKELRTLDLHINLISGSLPASLGSLANMQQLDVSYNQMNGSIPETIKELGKLLTLSLTGNSWQGTLTETMLHGLTNLEIFAVSCSRKDFILDLSCYWSPPFNLRYLEIENCKLGPKFPAWLRTQTQLFEISLKGVGISDFMPDWIWTVSPVQSFDFSNNEIRGTLSQVFALYQGVPETPSFIGSGFHPSWPSVKYLNLANNLIFGEIPSDIGQILLFIKVLNLSGNILTGPLPYSIGTMGNLGELDLSNNQLSGELQAFWRNLQELVILDLSNNNISGSIPGSLFTLPILSSLQLSNNNLSGNLSSLPSNDASMLSFIDLGGNKLSGKIPTVFGEMIGLSELRLRNNKFSGTIPEELCNLVLVHILDLSLNNLSGSIPECLGYLSGFYLVRPYISRSPLKAYMFTYHMNLNVNGREMTYSKTLLKMVNVFDLSSNSLTGEVPKDITILSALGTLNLSRNQLTGKIPEDIGSLYMLETLDLSWNHLSGPIPLSMTSMTLLNHLNLSFNCFSGPIPSTNQFLTFDDLSIYEGNPELCGRPLTVKCRGSNAREAENQGHDIDDDDEEGGSMFEVYTSTTVGFGFGFWVAFCSLSLCRTRGRVNPLPGWGT